MHTEMVLSQHVIITVSCLQWYPSPPMTPPFPPFPWQYIYIWATEYNWFTNVTRVSNLSTLYTTKNAMLRLQSPSSHPKSIGKYRLCIIHWTDKYTGWCFVLTCAGETPTLRVTSKRSTAPRWTNLLNNSKSRIWCCGLSRGRCFQRRSLYKMNGVIVDWTLRTLLRSWV